MARMNEYVVKDAITIRDDIIRTKRNGLIRNGVVNPNLGPGTDDFNTATALGNELAVIGANNIVRCDDQMADTSTGEGIDRIGAIFEKVKQPAAGSVGPIIMASSQPSPVVTGAILTDTAGLRYKVSSGGVYNNGDPITVEAEDTGAATNHPEGDVLQWANAPPFADDKVRVGPGGLINGIDAENDEVLRSRIYETVRTPASSGNWEDVAEDAEDSTPRVQKAFVYPAVQGPSTTDVAVTAAPTLTSKSRVLNSIIINSLVKPYVIGRHPTNAHLTITSVEDVEVDVAIGLAVPSAPTANPPGPGGGWLDGSPWPAPNAVTTFRCIVTAVTSSTQFTVDAQTPPIEDVAHIMWLSPIDWKVYTSRITLVTGTAGAYVITLEEPFTGIFVGCLISPQVQNASIYLAQLLSRFELMGPGEKSANPSALVRGFRHPVPSLNWPYTLGQHLLKGINDQAEVSTSQFLYRDDGTTTMTGPGGELAPQVPVAYAAPRQFIPRHIGFYRIP